MGLLRHKAAVSWKKQNCGNIVLAPFGHGNGRRVSKSLSGFTIIEVLIVLAIAGLIMLIVFLAVPALQRSQRNTQRMSDASLVLAAIQNCLSSRNGLGSSCDSTAEISPAFLDTSQLQQLTDIAYNGAILAANQLRWTFALGVVCAPDGSTAAVGTMERRTIVAYGFEPSGGGSLTRCLDG